MRRSYGSERLKAALEAIREGMSIAYQTSFYRTWSSTENATTPFK